MRRPLEICVLVLCLMTSAHIIQAQIVPAVVNPPDSPVMLTSITSNTVDFLQVVTAKNVSDKTILSYQLGMIMSVPMGCGQAETYSDEEIFRIDRVNLAPGVSVETHDYKLPPAKVASFGSKVAAREVHTQIAVVRVDFSDGSSWSILRSGQIYDPALMSRAAAMECSDLPKAVMSRASANAAHCGRLIRTE